MPEVAALAVGAVACATDLRSARIPNALTFGSVLAGFLYHLLASGGGGWPTAVLGFAVGLIAFFPFFALGALGAGDVKLMAALGTWIGWQGTIYVALYGAIAGGVLAVLVALRHNYLRRAISNLRNLLFHWWLVGVEPLPELTLESKDGVRLPYALPIMTGLMVTLWRH